MNRASAPVSKEVVLLGGGHSHVAVLKMFGMDPVPGARVTLICKDVMTPYSGMLPGLIAGHYSFDEAHIDLRKLCRFAGAQFYRAEAAGLDLENRLVLLKDRPPVRFDLLSINTGSTPRSHDVPGAAKYTIPVKPVERFLAKLPEIINQAQSARGRTCRIAVVGGGAGGVELALSVQFHLSSVRREDASSREFHLVTDTDVILPTHNRRVQSKYARILRERGVRVHLRHAVVRVEPGLLHREPGEPVPFDIAFWVTSAAAPPWFAQAGLKADAGGFIAVNDCLQSLSHPFVFAAGDVAAVLNHPRPKSGVFAVRQGRPLADNVRRALTGQPLQSFSPQRQFLSLISTGNKYAVASRGPFAFEGEWVWRWKDWIDRRWMRKYQQLPMMANGGGARGEGAESSAIESQRSTLEPPAMRCGGCGAKVGSTVLRRVLERLKVSAREDVIIGLEAPDDAAVTVIPPGKLSLQTVDFFRALVNDPYLFGQIAANHSLNDIYAMGGEPRSALAMAMLPYAAEDVMEEQLFQLLSGALRVLDESNVVLSGGHTAEGAELAFGLVVQGVGDPNRLLRKSGMKPGDQLILTKPLGTGTLFAAEMRGAANGEWIEKALATMLLSNRAAAEIIQRHGATACTDVTGFGLTGHALEMANASDVGLEIKLAEVPLMEGALECIRGGILSSLHPDNLRARRAIGNLNDVQLDERFPILFDPQTAGGLLASVPLTNAAACVAQLISSGYRNAGIVGNVRASAQMEPRILINVQKDPPISET
ncbi:MAG: selenide, water dikinase SelD [Verrucomicrobia subdivision 3 bacterium]|nr:selenide, water dikinase SelD [Limisphaerales bacterium]